MLIEDKVNEHIKELEKRASYGLSLYHIQRMFFQYLKKTDASGKVKWKPVFSIEQIFSLGKAKFMSAFNFFKWFSFNGNEPSGHYKDCHYYSQMPLGMVENVIWP